MSGSMVTQEVTDAVMLVIDGFVADDKVFSAFDVTKIVNKDSKVAKHYQIKGIVHSLYMVGDLGNNRYSRELVTLDLGHDDADAFVYYPHSKTAYDHPLAKGQAIQAVDNGDGVPILDLNSVGKVADDDAVTVVVTDENRIQIPREILGQITLGMSRAYEISCNGNLTCRKAESDGRVRITEKAFPAGAKLNVSVKTNTIHVSPA